MGCNNIATPGDIAQMKQQMRGSGNSSAESRAQRLNRHKAEESERLSQVNKEMREMSRAAKGDWGEAALRAEMRRQLGHNILIEHTVKPGRKHGSTESGYDGVSFVEKNGRVELHIWEVKHYSEQKSGKPSKVRSIGAWRDKRDVDNVGRILEAAQQRANSGQMSQETYEQIQHCIQHNENIHWHVRLGSRTDIPISLLESAKSGIESLDVKQYTLRDMLQSSRK